MTRPATLRPESIQETRAVLEPESIRPSPARTPAESTLASRAIFESESKTRAPAIAEANPSGEARAIVETESRPAPPALLETIRTLGALLDDLERVRVANGNRIGALEREHGESLPHLDVVQKQIKAAEHLAELELKRAWRRHPLAPWAKEQHGVGEKSIARLIAIIGVRGEKSPYEWAPLYAPNVAKLWAYCGRGDPARKRRAGMTQAEAFKLGNPAAKKQTWLIACSMLKAGNRDWYDTARDRYKDRVHEKPCVRCGPSGHPAQPGSPWSDAHKHEAALRLVSKEFLKDLWVAARAIGGS